MATLEFKPPQSAEREPELNLLMPKGQEQSLWESLRQNFKDTFFPKKLPPLVLTSKPVPVRDIWGFYDYKGRGAFGSTIVHIIAVAIIISGAIFGKKVVEAVKPQNSIVLIAPDTTPILKPSKTLS